MKNNSNIREAMSATTATTTASMPYIPEAIQVNDHVTIMSNKISPQNEESPKTPNLPDRFLTTRAPATYDKVALVSAALGAGAGVGLCVSFTIPSLGFYIFAIAIFHLLEFWITSRFNPRSVGMWSFLLLNGIEYLVAHALVVAEYLLSWYIQGQAPTWHGKMLYLSVALIFAGQLIRSMAMIKAAQSFNHYVQQTRKDDHVLVKSGIYSIVRHPSYFGYFLWMVSCQLLLRNWASGLLAGAVLQFYFWHRLEIEEKSLIEFFGDHYIDYKRNVWSGIFFYS